MLSYGLLARRLQRCSRPLRLLVTATLSAGLRRVCYDSKRKVAAVESKTNIKPRCIDALTTSVSSTRHAVALGIYNVAFPPRTNMMDWVVASSRPCRYNGIRIFILWEYSVQVPAGWSECDVTSHRYIADIAHKSLTCSQAGVSSLGPPRILCHSDLHHASPRTTICNSGEQQYDSVFTNTWLAECRYVSCME